MAVFPTWQFSQHAFFQTSFFQTSQHAFFQTSSKFGKTHVGKTAITLEKFNSGNNCFCKSALWETTSLEHSWPLSATVGTHTSVSVYSTCVHINI